MAWAAPSSPADRADAATIRLAAPFWLAAALVAVMAVVFYALARNAKPPARRARACLRAAIFRSSGPRLGADAVLLVSFGGFVAMFLYLPKLLTECTT